MASYWITLVLYIKDLYIAFDNILYFYSYYLFVRDDNGKHRYMQTESEVLSLLMSMILVFFHPHERMTQTPYIG